MSRRVMAAGASLMMSLSVLMVVSTDPAAAAVPTSADLAAALDAPASVTVTAPEEPLSYAVASQAFNDLPSAGSSYVVLSTGKAADVFSPSVPNDQPSTDLGDPGPDVTTLNLSVAAQETPKCLLVDFSMGTEERVHTYVPTAPSDSLSVRRAGADTEWAHNAGGAYFSQVGQIVSQVGKPVPYEVNQVDYWHTPGDETDPLHGTVQDPRLPLISPIDSFATRDTAEVPIPASSSAQTVTVSVRDVGNGSLDSVALVDKVRLASSCSFEAEGMTPETGLAATKAVIVGHRGVGNLLTLDPVRLTPDVEKYDAHGANGWITGDVELRFRWYRSHYVGTSTCYSSALKDWHAIPDADRQSYVPTNVDKNRCLMALVTGIKDGHRVETFPTSVSPDWWHVTLPIQDGAFDGQPPTIACDVPPLVGMELSAGVVDFVPRPDSYAYQWYANGSPISGQTAKKVVLSANEAGKAITVKVTAKRSGFDDRTETSAACGPVGLMTMSTTSDPIITGTPSFGQTLGVDTGTWEPSPVSFSYQWRLDDAVITGATRSTYAPKSSDVGHEITVSVTGAKAGYLPMARVSEPVGIDVGVMSGATPVITGTPKVARTLTVDASGWQPVGSTLAYTWFAGTTELRTSASRSFVVPGSAAGKRITVVAHGTRAGYAPLERTSAPTAVVAKGTLTTSSPGISGRLKVGRMVSVRTLDWGPYGVKKTYRWMLNGKFYGRSTTKMTLTLPKSARGKKLGVRVTGSMPGYTTVTRTKTLSSRVSR